MKKTCIIAAITLVGLASQASAFTYFPTQQDRQDIAACMDREGHTMDGLRVCVVNVGQALVLREVPRKRKAWSDHPSQIEVWLRLAGASCGLPDNPSPTPSTGQLDCMNQQSRELNLGLVEGFLRYGQTLVRQ
jgi:hypothetical protein